MDATRRTTTLRRVATTASLAAFILVPAGQAEAAKSKPRSPVITKVTPMNAKVGQTLTIKGKHFRKGKSRNSVGFKREGAAVVFVRSDLSTKKTMTVRLPAKLEKVMFGTATTFKLRVLAARFGKSYTSNRLSPTIRPRPLVVDPTDPASPTDPQPTPDPANPELDCDEDGAKNGADADDDNDGLKDTLEEQIGTNSCLSDSDGDKLVDGFEYRSGIDLNDDEYQRPNETLPYPGKRPYPNPLDGADAGTDYDGDGLTLAQEHELWQGSTPDDQETVFELPEGSSKATPLTYSDGLQYSVAERCPTAVNPDACQAGDENRRVPTQAAGSYSRFAEFTSWATEKGYLPTVRLHDRAWAGHPANEPDHVEGRFDYSPFDVDRDGQVSPTESSTLERDGDGWLSDDERDEDADGLNNQDEFNGRMLPQFWAGCYDKEVPYPIAYTGTDATVADTDGDGVRDGMDDQDHDDVPNVMELSRFDASHLDDTDRGIKCKPLEDLDEETPNHPNAFGMVNPFNPCMPDPDSRTCARYVGVNAPAPFSGPLWWALQ